MFCAFPGPLYKYNTTGTVLVRFCTSLVLNRTCVAFVLFDSFTVDAHAAVAETFYDVGRQRQTCWTKRQLWSLCHNCVKSSCTDCQWEGPCILHSYGYTGSICCLLAVACFYLKKMSYKRMYQTKTSTFCFSLRKKRYNIFFYIILNTNNPHIKTIWQFNSLS